MTVAVIACAIGLLVVLVALLRDGPVTVPAAAHLPWRNLPDPTDVARAEFGLTYPGYDPASVDAHLDAVARAWADLLAAAPPEVILRAESRVAARTGGQPPALRAAEPAAVPSSLTGTDVSSDAEALRAEVALDAVAESP